MKRTEFPFRIIISIFLFFFCTSLDAQPQGFNYQAVARDETGAVLANKTLTVYFSLLDENQLQWWKEKHEVSTNEFGLFSVIICNNNSDRIVGAASSLDNIPWGSGQISINVKIDDGSGTYDMGTNPLLAVPYALVALSPENSQLWSKNNENIGYLDGKVGVGTLSPEGRLTIQGENANTDDPIFMVTRQDGFPIFAVYEDGVYAYIDEESEGKSLKGGFAVGGYKRAKGIEQEYMRVTADSIRFYVDQDESGKGIKGGFAVGGYKRAKGIGDEFLRITPDSVRIYIDDDDSKNKGIKGGFAVGGYNRAKGTGDEFLRVSHDSVRIYIDDNPDSKGIKGGFAVGGYKRAKSPGEEYFNVSTSQSADVIPGENRIVWYPQRNAFMSGRVLVENASDVGINSMASGYETKARGDYSQAFGYQSMTTGPYSMAIGQASIADTSSFAFGKNAIADGNESFAFGSGASANGLRSFAIGSVGLDSLGNVLTDKPTRSSGTYSIAMGLGAQASSKGSMSFGVSSEANEEYALAIGYGSQARGLHSLAIGSRSSFSESVMYPAPHIYTHNSPNIARGALSTSIGNGNLADDGGLAIGLSNWAQGWGSAAIGYNNDALGDKSVAMGYHAKTTGNNATAIGTYVEAQSFNSFVVGSLNTIEGDPDNWIETDPLFVVGNGENLGSSTVRSNAFVVRKNGDALVYGNMGSSTFSGRTGSVSDTLFIGAYKTWGSTPYISMKAWQTIPSYQTFQYYLKANSSGFQITNESTTLARFNTNNTYLTGNLEASGDSKFTGGDMQIWSGTKALQIRQDNSASYISNHTGFVGNGSSSNGSLILNGEGGVVLAYGSAGSWGNQGLTLNTNGFVGIGTTSPNALLNVVSFSNNIGVVRGESKYTGTGAHYAGVFEAINSSTGVGCYAAGGSRDFWAAGAGINFYPFTGSHEVILSNNIDSYIKPGMLVSLTGRVEKRQMDDGSTSISSTMPEVKLTTEENDKAIFGVFVSEDKRPDDHWLKKDIRAGTVNALGEGRVWVCSINGSIEAGDYITSSSVPGYGKRQDDDLLHNYTLGKATETIDWNSVSDTVTIDGKLYKVYLIGVVYTSG